MGWNLSKLLGSAPGFLKTGVVAAILKDDGTILELRERYEQYELWEEREKEDMLLPGELVLGQANRWRN